MRKVIITANLEEKCPYCGCKEIEHTVNGKANCIKCNNIIQLYDKK